MAIPTELLTAVDTAFATTGRGTPPWSDPNPDRSPSDDQYSRVTNPEKWRILGARADAWVIGLVETGLAEVERDVEVAWSEPPHTHVTRADRVVPHAPTALPLVIGRSRIEGVDDAGVTLAVGDPAVFDAAIPNCGCDACDRGSDDALDELDDHIVAVVSGQYRHLRRGDRQITARGDHGRQATGRFRRGEVSAILDDPTGWQETTGSSWIGS